MADIIKCPVCGENNFSNQEFCQFCQSRLQLSSDPLKGADAPIKPGQVPTKKNTAELEPILPQWLRDARDLARKEEQQNLDQQASQKSDETKPIPTDDLLAGLRSQALGGEEDETPDWLANITGAKPTQKKSTAESSEVRWVELGDKSDFAEEEAEIDPDKPSWLAGITPTEPQPDEKDELTDWFRNADDSKPVEPSKPSTTLDIPSADDTPDWLRQMAAAEDLKKEQASSFESPSGVFPPEASETPDWLRGLEDKASDADSGIFAESSAGESEAFDSSASGELPAWLNDQTESPKPVQDTTPKWLKKEADPSKDADLPAWLSKNDEPDQIPSTPAQELAAEESVQDDAFSGLPDWLKASAPQSSLFEHPEEQTTVGSSDFSLDTPDWLSTFKPGEAPRPESAAPAMEKETPFDMPPAFVPDAQTGESMDDLFTEMPDWLSTAVEPGSESIPTPIINTDAIAPGELPSWVQAMRPVDAAISSLSPSYSSDQTLESRGALAGLQGVLPSMPGFTPTSKPKPYSIRLQASEEQQSHAALLEQILAAETAPVPIASFSALRASRGLRWFLFFVIFAAVFSALLLPAPLFSMPLGVPRELGGALDISRSIPEGAPVLVAFDYEASRVGEMEVSASPFFDQMILLKHPRLTFISTNETGAILAERFITGPLAGHNYENGINYLNLGYLPGGQMGIRAFAQNPRFISPMDTSLQPAWNSAPLEGVTALAQFTALILITDNADAARVWIEQTESARGGMPVIVISSAQAAPMIQPYFDSGQVTGMVAGLYGGAVFEQNNAGRPGTARDYWDAYSLSMLLTMSLVLGGGLWNLVLGLRDRASAREAK